MVKSDNIKKALETEMRSLTIRMEEIETNTVATSRRTIQKMEQRIGKKISTFTTFSRILSNTVSFHFRGTRSPIVY